MTPGIAALGQQAVERIVKTIAVFDDSAAPMTHTKNTTLALSKPRARRYFLK